MQTTKEASQHKMPQNSRAQGARMPAQQTENALSKRISAGPKMMAQRKKIDRLSAPADPIQKQSEPEEEELAQGKFVDQGQGLEEDDLMQGAFASVAPHAVNAKPE